VWRAKDEPRNNVHLRRCIEAVVEEYAVRRKLAVEIVPAPLEENWPEFERVLVEAGFIDGRRTPAKRTIVMNLERSLAELESGMHKKWRNCLNYARRVEQEVIEGDSIELFEEFGQLYEKMLVRKSFETSTSLSAFRDLQRRLTTQEKMRVFICKSGSDVCAGAIVSLLGETGLYLFGASDGPGLEKKSSYLVQARVLAWLKENGARRYDLNGVNEVTNPGGYAFKSRLAGRNGQVVATSPFVMAHSSLSRLLVVTGHVSFRVARNARHALASLVGRGSSDPVSER
jgi:lipid II:glycine glycyltransferase (peptidoglycan interpeptide bridge formation enzyme)